MNERKERNYNGKEVKRRRKMETGEIEVEKEKQEGEDK